MTEPLILTVTPLPGSTSTGPRMVARFSVQIGEIRLHNLLLREWPDGTRRVIAGNIAGTHCASFQPEIAAKITSRASAALISGGQIARTEFSRTA